MGLITFRDGDLLITAISVFGLVVGHRHASGKLVLAVPLGYNIGGSASQFDGESILLHGNIGGYLFLVKLIQLALSDGNYQRCRSSIQFGNNVFYCL